MKLTPAQHEAARAAFAKLIREHGIFDAAVKAVEEALSIRELSTEDGIKKDSNDRTDQAKTRAPDGRAAQVVVAVK